MGEVRQRASRSIEARAARAQARAALARAQEEEAASRLRTSVLEMQAQGVRRIAASGYGDSGASSRKSALRAYRAASHSTEDDIQDHLSVLAQRSRDQFMSNPIARGALQTHVTHVVGGGLQLKPAPDAGFLGWSEAQAEDWVLDVQREWQLFAETPDCSLERQFYFDELQQTAFLSALMSGDCFALLPLVLREGVRYDLCIHLIEADRVLNPNFYPVNGFKQQVQQLPDGGWISGGIEFGADGGVRAYHVAQWHPLSMQFTRHLREWKTIPTHAIAPRGPRTGRRNILHLLQVERPEQRRGVPLLAPVIEDLLQLRRYTEAELMAAVVTGMLTVFIKTPNPTLPLGMNTTLLEGGTATPVSPDAYRLGNGTILGLEPGEEVEVVDPKRPVSGFGGFVQAVCEQLGPALGLPYEVLLQHFSSSYSASRAALVMAWKAWSGRRRWMARRFCQPVYEEFLAEAVGRGRVQAPGFFRDPLLHAAYCRANWHGPSQGSIEPVKEAQGAILRIEAGLSDEEREAAEINGSEARENITRHAGLVRLQRALLPAALPTDGEGGGTKT